MEKPIIYHISDSAFADRWSRRAAKPLSIALTAATRTGEKSIGKYSVAGESEVAHYTPVNVMPRVRLCSGNTVSLQPPRSPLISVRTKPE
jgi:hypothetical protein